MKAVILEKKDGYAAALKDDGTIVRMRDNNYTIGDVIMMKEKKPLFNKKWGTLVAALLIFAMVGTTTLTYAAPFYFVGFEDEDDEQIVFEVNRYDRIIGVEFADEGIELDLKDLDLDNMKIDSAVLAVMAELGLKYEDPFFIRTSETEDGDLEAATRLAARIQERLREMAEIGRASCWETV